MQVCKVYSKDIPSCSPFNKKDPFLTNIYNSEFNQIKSFPYHPTKDPELMKLRSDTYNVDVEKGLDSIMKHKEFETRKSERERHVPHHPAKRYLQTGKGGTILQKTSSLA